jgi:hypothetical protein
MKFSALNLLLLRKKITYKTKKKNGLGKVA